MRKLNKQDIAKKVAKGLKYDLEEIENMSDRKLESILKEYGEAYLLDLESISPIMAKVPSMKKIPSTLEEK